MDFLILTNNEFFRLVNDGADGRTITASVYNEFIKEVCAVCCAPPSERHHLVFTLAYIETELGSLHEVESSHANHIRKALFFVRRMLKYVQTQVPPLSIQKSDIPIPSFRWTGTLIELVELIYGLQEIGCINDGETPINELTGYFGKLLGIEIKDILCYNTYANMKHRKNESRTYFLDKMRERLNLRMQRDDERERLRR